MFFLHIVTLVFLPLCLSLVLLLPLLYQAEKGET